MNGVGGTVRNELFFADYAKENIQYVYIPLKDIPDEPKEKESTQYVKEMSVFQV